MQAADLWYGKSPGLALLRGLLTPASWLYAAGWQGYASLYRLGLKQSAEPHRPVVCVGNLTVGGSGKTPIVAYLAKGIRSRLGRSVVLSCSGYGSPAAEAAAIAPHGDLDPAKWGDEPAHLRTLAPEVPIIVGRRRVLAAEFCHREFPGAVLLMDDGYQHLPLRKHVSILLDPERGNSRCLPAGPYREPRANAARADLVLPGAFKAVTTALLPPGTEGDVQMLCAIGDPDRFRRDLEGLGLRIVAEKRLADHDDLAGPTLLKGFREDVPILTTAKDWVKLQKRGDLGPYDIRVVGQEARIEPEDEFWAWLGAKLNEQG